MGSLFVSKSIKTKLQTPLQPRSNILHEYHNRSLLLNQSKMERTDDMFDTCHFGSMKRVYDRVK